MNRSDKFELIYVKLAWLFLILGLISFVFQNINTLDNIRPLRFVTIILLLIIYAALNGAKYFLITQKVFNYKYFYAPSRAIEILIIQYFLLIENISVWAIILFLTIFLTYYSKGKKYGNTLIYFALLIQIAFKLANILFITKNYSTIFSMLLDVCFYYFGIALFGVLCGKINKDNVEREAENIKLVNQLNEKYAQLASAQDEIKYHFGKLKDTNLMLEDTNKRLSINIAEFYTLQQISQAISSIFDINELLKRVNDIIIGVMGVNYSTIILYDEKKNKLSVNTTNINSKEELSSLYKDISSPVLLEAINNDAPIIENFVDSKKLLFAKGRDVHSFICLPLNTKSHKFGLVLIEHKYRNAFDKENVRLLGIIGQQVGIAMENAELYNKMQEMAMKDGLTGIYNRMYFQERLIIELQNAKEGNYDLSMAIFDIDHFKKFNDTYGHLFGDKVLKSITVTVINMLGSTDVFARYGGEEFVILFPNTKLADAYLKAEEIRQKIAKTYVRDNVITATVTVSFGLAGYPENAKNENELIRLADDALYEAKSNGRNCTAVTQKTVKFSKIN